MIKPVQGTMKVHAAVGLGNNSVMVRDVSCFCFKCFEGVKFCEESCCDGWENHNFLEKQKKKGETNSDVPITPVVSSSNKEGNAEVAKSSEEILTLTLEIENMSQPSTSRIQTSTLGRSSKSMNMTYSLRSWKLPQLI